jgi:hypothetical protein
MDDRDSLLSIARELRRFAGLAYGSPERVPVTAGNLNDLANRIEQIAIGETRPEESRRA